MRAEWWFVALAGLLMCLMVGLHEEVHYRIFEYDGCAQPRINWLPTYAECMDENYQESDEAKLAHMLNEVAGYPMGLAIILLVAIFCIMLMLLNQMRRMWKCVGAIGTM